MSDNMNVYEKARSVPPEALKAIQGGRLKGMSDINPMWRIKMLTELFGMCGVGWKMEITDRRLVPGGGDETVCFVDINLYVKVDGTWSEAIPGQGGSSFVTMERNGLFTSDECFKMATTDAIGSACKMLGMAADVYFEKDRTKYSQGEEAAAQAPQLPYSAPSSQSTQQQPRPSQPSTGATSKPISDAQIKLIGTQKSKKNMADDVYRSLLANFGVESTKDLTSSQASKVIEHLMSYVPEPIAVGGDDLPF